MTQGKSTWVDQALSTNPRPSRWRFSQRYPGMQDVAARWHSVSTVQDATLEQHMAGD